MPNCSRPRPLHHSTGGGTLARGLGMRREHPVLCCSFLGPASESAGMHPQCVRPPQRQFRSRGNSVSTVLQIGCWRVEPQAVASTHRQVSSTDGVVFAAGEPRRNCADAVMRSSRKTFSLRMGDNGRRKEDGLANGRVKPSSPWRPDEPRACGSPAKSRTNRTCLGVRLLSTLTRAGKKADAAASEIRA